MGMVSPANRVRSLRRRFIAAALLACLALTLAACGRGEAAGVAVAQPVQVESFRAHKPDSLCYMRPKI